MNSKKNKTWMWFAGATALWLGSYLFIRYFLGLEDDSAGTFGDQFGAINALFTGLSFAGIIITLRQQQEELSAQRREFMNSRATNFLYQQVKLMNVAFDNLTYLIFTPEAPHGNQVHSFTGNGAYNIMMDELNSRSTHGVELNILMKKILAHSQQLLRITSNSVNLLERLREIENMSIVDSQFLFESFYFNVDSRIWNLVDRINSVERMELDSELLEIYNKDIDRIIIFKKDFKNNIEQY